MEHRMGCTMDDAEHGAEQNGIQDYRCWRKIPFPESDRLLLNSNEQKKAYAELNDQFLRLAADFENFKKRTAREQGDRQFHLQMNDLPSTSWKLWTTLNGH